MKNAAVLERGLASLELARDHGVTMAFGTDLIGETQTLQATELAIRNEVLPAAEILTSMWVTTGRICGLQDEIGVVEPGAYGDLVVSRVDPLTDLVAFSDVTAALSHVIQGGRIVADR